MNPGALIYYAIAYLEEQERRLDPELQKADRNAVNKAYAMGLSRAMDRYPGISYKGLRAIYAECQWALLPEAEKAKTEKHVMYADWLGHIDKDGSQDATLQGRTEITTAAVTDGRCAEGQQDCDDRRIRRSIRHRLR